jgi:hypothetical protein
MDEKNSLINIYLYIKYCNKSIILIKFVIKIGQHQIIHDLNQLKLYLYNL